MKILHFIAENYEKLLTAINILCIEILDLGNHVPGLTGRECGLVTKPVAKSGSTDFDRVDTRIVLG